MKYCFLVVMCLIIAACQSAPAPPPSSATWLSPVGAANDACALRLQDISEAMLMYYSSRKHLPATLDELQPLAGQKTKLQFTCPDSGQAYIYAAAGKAIGNEGRMLVLYDATPAHNGQRWGIEAASAQGNQPLGLWVVQLDESTLRAYQQSPPPIAR